MRVLREMVRVDAGRCDRQRDEAAENQREEAMPHPLFVGPLTATVGDAPFRRRRIFAGGVRRYVSGVMRLDLPRWRTALATTSSTSLVKRESRQFSQC